MARTTVANTIQRIRRQAAGGYRNEFNVLATTVTDTDTTLVMTYDLAAGLKAGAIICIGLETMRVLDSDTTAKTLTVLRGWLDSDAAAHTAGDEVWISPRYQPVDIYDAMVAELQSWGPSLYRPFGAEVTISSNDYTVELPATFIGCYGICSIRRHYDSSVSTAWPELKFRMQRAPGTTWTNGAPTSGLLVRFIEAIASGRLFVTAAMPFVLSTMSYTADLIADVKLAESQLDVLEMGVKLRMGIDNESNRNNRMAQDEPRRAEETPVGSSMQGFQFSNALYRNRKLDEIQKLRAQYPIRYQ